MAGYQPRHDTDPVWFNGQQVNALTYVSAQVGVLITAVYGWDDRPDVRDTRENRAGDDGEWADNLFLGGRTITVEGEVMGSSWVNLQSRKRALAAIFNPTSDEVLFKIPDPATASPTGVYADSGMTGYERVYCRVIEAIQFGDTLDPMCQTWQVVLRASDPRIYSDIETTTSSGTSGTASRTATVDQTGTYKTPVEIVVAGPTGASWSVSEPSSGLVVGSSALTLASGASATINTMDRTMTVTGGYGAMRASINDAVAVWMFDETSGTTADNIEGTSAYDATYTGGFTLNQTGPASGVAAVDLNGTTGYVSVPYNAALNPSVFTMEIWVYFDAGNCYIFDNISSNKGVRLFCGVSGTTTLTLGTGSSTSLCGVLQYDLQTSRWYHLAVTYDGVRPRMYVDGREDSVCNTTAYSPKTSGILNVGRLAAGSSYLNGKVAAFAIYNSALSSAAIKGLYDASSSVSTLDAYRFVNGATARWASLEPDSSTYTLASSGLNTGSQLSVKHRDARL